MSELLNVDDHMKKEANIPMVYWNSLPHTEQIKNAHVIRSYFSERVKYQENFLIPNCYVHSKNTTHTEKVMTKVVMGFLARHFSVYCVSASYFLETVENRNLFLAERENGFESLSHVKILAIYGLGTEPDNDYGKSKSALQKILEKRFFNGLPTLVCGELSKDELYAESEYSAHFLNRLFTNCVTVSV